MTAGLVLIVDDSSRSATPREMLPDLWIEPILIVTL